MAKSAPKHFFSKVASVEMPRSLFNMDYVDTFTLSTDYLYPNYQLLVIPGDTVSLDYSSFTRLVAPINVPMMDNLYMEQHFWFVPWRLVWDYTKNFFGEQRRPEDPTDFTIPQIEIDGSELVTGSIWDYLGIPVNQVPSGTKIYVNALLPRSLNLTYDDWYRDEQRVDYLYANFGNQTVSASGVSYNGSTVKPYELQLRGKRFDAFTSSLLEPQAGVPVNIPLGTSAPVYATGVDNDVSSYLGNLAPLHMYGSSSLSDGVYTSAPNAPSNNTNMAIANTSGALSNVSGTVSVGNYRYTPSNLIADLALATPATIPTLRQAFQIQAYNEICQRNGTRMTEFIYGHYGVISPDSRLQRPEFLGRTFCRLSVQPIVQNSGTTTSENTENTPLGTLGGIVAGGNSESVFTRSFTEFGYIFSFVNIYSDLTYFQGLDRHWSVKTPLDLPLPVFGNLTDEAIPQKELYLSGVSTQDDIPFGFGERYYWAKYAKNSLRGLVRPNATLSIGYWSLAQELSLNSDGVLPNNDEFILSDTPIDRINAVSDQPAFICNQKFTVKLTRELPAYSDPMKWFMRG